MGINKRLMLLVAGMLLSLAAMAQQKLNDYVEQIVKDPDLESATVAISIYNATTGMSIYNYNENKSLIPASIVKLLTTGVGFEELGRDFRFKTSIGYTGEVDKRGVLQGDVFIIGGGDPVLGSYRYKQTAIDSVFAKWKKALETMGVKKINRRVCYDASIFDDKPLHDTWMWGDIGNYYGCGAYGLNIHENMYFCHFDAGSKMYQKATLTDITPKGIDVINQVDVATGDANSGDGVIIYGQPTTNVRVCAGTVPLGKRNFKVRGAMPNPPKSCAEMFAKYLNNNGIEVSNYVTEISRKGRDITMLFDYYSPIYTNIATYTNHTSNNIYAESIFKYLGYQKYKVGTFETGGFVIDDFIKKNNLVAKGVSIVDGSGLSRQNMMTTKFMCSFLAEIAKKTYYKDYLKTLSQIGKSGTAKNMLKSKHLKRDIYMKTGSMKGVKSYAGYIVDSKGEVITFCFMVNNFDCSQAKVGKKMEQILLMVID